MLTANEKAKFDARSEYHSEHGRVVSSDYRPLLDPESIGSSAILGNSPRFRERIRDYGA